MLFTPFPNLETERLILRDTSSEDRSVLFFLQSDPGVRQYIKKEPLKKIEEADALLKKIRMGIAANQNVLWAITLKDRAEMIGTICLWNFSADRTRAEVGYALHTDYHGQGLMSEALKAVLDFGFNKLNFEEIEAFTHRDNQRSKKMLSVNGFELQAARKDEDNVDNVIYSLKKAP